MRPPSGDGGYSLSTVWRRWLPSLPSGAVQLGLMLRGACRNGAALVTAYFYGLLLFRYHLTVDWRPAWKSTWGCQPSSCWILVESIA